MVGMQMRDHDEFDAVEDFLRGRRQSTIGLGARPVKDGRDPFGAKNGSISTIRPRISSFSVALRNSRSFIVLPS